MGRGWQLSCTSVSLPLSQPSPLGKSTCPSLAQLQRSSSTARAIQYMLKVCIWSDCDSHFNRTEVWFCLADSNASQMDPITCLIVATSCRPFLFLFSGSTLHLSPASQMRQSYHQFLASIYIQGLFNGRLLLFLSCNNVKWTSVRFLLLCALFRCIHCKKRQYWFIHRPTQVDSLLQFVTDYVLFAVHTVICKYFVMYLPSCLCLCMSLVCITFRNIPRYLKHWKGLMIAFCIRSEVKGQGQLKNSRCAYRDSVSCKTWLLY